MKRINKPNLQNYEKCNILLQLKREVVLCVISWWVHCLLYYCLPYYSKATKIYCQIFPRNQCCILMLCINVVLYLNFYSNVLLSLQQHLTVWVLSTNSPRKHKKIVKLLTKAQRTLNVVFPCLLWNQIICNPPLVKNVKSLDWNVSQPFSPKLYAEQMMPPLMSLPCRSLLKCERHV